MSLRESGNSWRLFSINISRGLISSYQNTPGARTAEMGWLALFAYSKYACTCYSQELHLLALIWKDSSALYKKQRTSNLEKKRQFILHLTN